MNHGELKRGALLHDRRFLPLFVTQFLGAFNDNVFKNALVIYITFGAIHVAREDTAILVTTAAGLFILPFFLFSAIAGQWADKLEKAALIRMVKASEIAIMTLAAVGFALGEVWFLIFVLFLMGTQSAIFGPAKYAILPQHLATSELAQGNGLIQMATFLAILLGTILGGVVVAMEDVGRALISALVLFLAVSGWAASRWIPPAAPPDPGLLLRWNLLAHTFRIIGYARENRTVFISIIGISWFWFVGATYLQLLPSYTRDVLGGDAHVVTALLTAFSVGIGLGAVLCGRLSAGRIEVGLIPVGAAGLSLFTIGVFLAGGNVAAGVEPVPLAEFFSNPRHWIIALNFLAVAFFGGAYIVPLFSLVQARAAPERRAQIIAANNVINALLMVASAVATIALLKGGYTAGEVILFVGLASAIVTSAILIAVPEFGRGLVKLIRSRSFGT